MKLSLTDIKIYGYTAIVLLLHVLYIMIFIGMGGGISADFVQKLSTGIQIAVGLFLFIKFFPFREHKFEPGDSAIIFGCSTFILTNVGVTSLVMRFIEKGVFGATGFRMSGGAAATQN